jgi:ATP-dependent Lon protease
MKEIKERILEFIALGKIKGSLKGKILCLVGSAGVGKTSLAGNIALALGRKFARVSLGGESDSSTLKGHRKTYIGSYPGKIVAALRECGTENCVILLDEVDKLGR